MMIDILTHVHEVKSENKTYHPYASMGHFEEKHTITEKIVTKIGELKKIGEMPIEMVNVIKTIYYLDVACPVSYRCKIEDQVTKVYAEILDNRKIGDSI